MRAELTPELLADATADAAQRIVSPFQAGRLQGLLEARDLVLPGLADQLGELAGLARYALNAAHNAAVPYPPPGSLAGTRTDTADFAGAARSGTAYLAVIDLATGDAVTTIAVDVAGAADAAGLAAQIAAGLGGFGTAALNGQGALQIAARRRLRHRAGEGDSADHRHRCRRPRARLWLRALFRAQRSPGRQRLRPDASWRSAPTSLADSRRLSRSRLDVDRRRAADRPARRRRRQSRRPGARRRVRDAASATVARGGLPAGDFTAGRLCRRDRRR